MSEMVLGVIRAAFEADGVIMKNVALRKASDAIERLTKERDEAREWSAKQAMDIITLGQVAARAESAEARVAKLEEALRPFAAIAEHDIASDETDTDRFIPMRFNSAPNLTVGDLRRASAALGNDHGNVIRGHGND